jgi:hypothetical protein
MLRDWLGAIVPLARSVELATGFASRGQGRGGRAGGGIRAKIPPICPSYGRAKEFSNTLVDIGKMLGEALRHVTFAGLFLSRERLRSSDWALKKLGR